MDRSRTRSIAKQSDGSDKSDFFRNRRGGKKHKKTRDKETLLVNNSHDGNYSNVNSVVVLTPTILSIEQVEVLEKGLNFSPDSDFDLFHTILDVNWFARLLTVKRHLFTNDYGNDTNIESMETVCSNPENEYSDLLSREQVSLVALQNLSDVPLDGNQGCNKDVYNIKHSNPLFYPRKLRVPDLDVFQTRVEKDLIALKTRENSSKMCMFKNNLTVLP